MEDEGRSMHRECETSRRLAVNRVDRLSTWLDSRIWIGLKSLYPSIRL
jgi:hypothetical protein